MTIAGSVLFNIPNPIDERLAELILGRGRLDWSNATTLGLSDDGGGSLFDVKVRSIDNTIQADGTDSGAVPAPDTFFFVYWDSNSRQLYLCDTAPTRISDGSWRLGTTAATTVQFVFVGWCQTIDDGTGLANFIDEPARRYVASMNNRRRKSLFACPGYVDDNAKRTLAPLTTAAFAGIAGGVGDFVSYISNGEDAVELDATFVSNLVLAGDVLVGVGDNSAADPSVCACLPSASLAGASASVAARFFQSAPGKYTANLCARTGAVAVTFVSDYASGASAHDPAATYLAGSVWV